VVRRVQKSNKKKERNQKDTNKAIESTKAKRKAWLRQKDKKGHHSSLPHKACGTKNLPK
jgi:hypothetical protein